MVRIRGQSQVLTEDDAKSALSSVSLALSAEATGHNPEVLGALQRLSDACNGSNTHWVENRTTLVQLGGASQLIALLGGSGDDAGTQEQLTLRIQALRVLKDLASGNAQHGGEELHAALIFEGLATWLCRYMKNPPGRPGLMAKVSQKVGITYSGYDTALDLCNALVLRMAGTLTGLKGLLTAGGTTILLHDLRATITDPHGLTKQEMAEAQFLAAASVVKHQTEMRDLGELEDSYSMLVDVAGRMLRDEVSSLLKDLKDSDADAVVTSAMHRLCWLSLFSESIAQSIQIKLLPVLRGMVNSQQVSVVSRASTAVTILCSDSPHVACLVG
jgi:hypothetical protein